MKVLIKKYGSEGTHLEQQRLAIARLTESRRRRAPPLPHAKGARPDAEAAAEADDAELAAGGEDSPAAETTQ